MKVIGQIHEQAALSQVGRGHEGSPVAHCLGLCVGHKACPDAAGKRKISMLLIELRFLDGRTCSIFAILAAISFFFA
jgi:hypothetical protein